mgnify:FL=1
MQLWDKRRCPHCDKLAFWELHCNGKASCTACGTLCDSHMFEGFQTSYAHGYSPLNSLQQNQVYTRTKRFVKYLNRASMKQSVNSVPDDTWAFLIDHGAHILRTLKKAKLKRKCYDCLPLLTHHLCPDVSVPRLSEREQRRALEYFDIIDQAFPHTGSFMSYLYVLEFILIQVGRQDVLPYISRIQCQKRRAKYGTRLAAIIRDAISGGSLPA